MKTSSALVAVGGCVCAPVWADIQTGQGSCAVPSVCFGLGTVAGLGSMLGASLLLSSAVQCPSAAPCTALEGQVHLRV